MKTKSKTIGQNIRKFRKAAGLTQEELATKCGLATITIQQYELGKREPRYEQQQTICDALNIPMIALVSGETDDDMNSMFYAGMLEVYAEVKKNPVHWVETLPLKQKLFENYDSLNLEGKREAVRRISELAELPQYTIPDAPYQEGE